MPLATSSKGDGIDSEEAIAVAFVSEFQTFKKINQENLETTAIGRTIRIWNGHVQTWYVSLGELIDNQLNLAFTINKGHAHKQPPASWH
ncbi:MAG: hypothetical protein JSY10_02360 [Paenibacillus sp.]|nr:hypothetical protein [Paenibacillus sp.]